MWMLLSLFMISSCLFHNGYCFQHSGVNFYVVLKCFKIYFSIWVLTRQCLSFLLAEVFCMKFNRGCPFTNMSIYSQPQPPLVSGNSPSQMCCKFENLICINVLQQFLSSDIMFMLPFTHIASHNMEMIDDGTKRNRQTCQVCQK